MGEKTSAPAPETGRTEELGALFAGRFRIEALLGRGGYAEVYRVTNLNLGRTEALKVLTSRPADDPSWAERFQQEARLVASLEHRNIVKVHDSGQTGGVLWYSMQYVEARTLGAELAEKGRFDEAGAASLAIPLLDALSYSHERGVVHRDIKPGNVLVDKRGEPHLMDFGIAKSPEAVLRTQTGVLVGTPAFISPEQALGRPIDGRADLYSLGVTLFQLVTGRYPFEAKDPIECVVLRLTDDPRPLHAFRPDVDPTFEAIVLTALRRDPRKRFPSAASMRAAFQAFLRGDSEAVTREVPAVAESLRTHSIDRVGLADAVREKEGAPRPAAPDDAQLTALVAAPSPALSTARPTALEAPPAGAPPRPSRRTLAAIAVVAVVAAIVAAAGVLVPLLTSRSPAGAGQGPAPAAPPAGTASRAAAPTSEPPPPTEAPPASPPPLRVVRTPAAEPAAAPPVRRAVVPPEEVQRDESAPPGLPESCAGKRVGLSIVVGEDGRVARRSYLDGDRACAPFAMEVVDRWTWKPARDAGGAPVTSRPLAVEVGFPP